MISILTDFEDTLKMYSLPLSHGELEAKLQHNCRIGTRSEWLLESDLSSVDIYWGHKPDMDEIQVMTNLRWIHLGTSGYDRLDLEYLRQKRIMVTTSNELNAESVALSALALVLQDLRGSLFSTSIENKSYASLWEKRKQFETRHPQSDVASNKTVFILGRGAIGSRVMKMTHNLGFQVLALDSQGLVEINTFGEEKQFSLENLQEFVSQADYIVNCLPRNLDTDNLVNSVFLEGSQPSLYYISVGRWTTTNERDLVSMVRAKRIRGAALDVYSQDFMSIASDLVCEGSVVTMPHVAGNHSSYWQSQLDLFQYNLNSFVSGSELRSRLL